MGAEAGAAAVSGVRRMGGAGGSKAEGSPPLSAATNAAAVRRAGVNAGAGAEAEAGVVLMGG